MEHAGSREAMTGSAARGAAALVLAAAFLLAAAGGAAGQVTHEIQPVEPPEQGFFSKRLVARGIPIAAHASASDAALEEAGRRIDRLLGRCPGIAANLARLGAAIYVIGKDQQTSDLPMYRHLKGKPFDGKATIDERGRGYGGLHASCSEENLLLLPADRFRDHRDICTHEFAHTILDYGVSRDVRRQVERQWRAATSAGKWKTAYAASSAQEYFAELTMWYVGSRGDYGKIDPPPQRGAAWLRFYDPEGYALLDSIYSGRVDPGKRQVVDLPRLDGTEEGKLRSKPGQPATEVIFINRSAAPVRLFWLDTEGKRKGYGEVRPGGVASQSTFLTHAWLLAGEDGKVLGIYLPDAATGRVVIEPQRPTPSTGPAAATRPASSRPATRSGRP